ncbi:MAG: hypothetical protein J6U23_10515 [Clostridiales bacterium]|nr:hypothetical protein [Clostridiales bacterium]
MNKKGSIAIEASVVFTVFLIILSVCITSMNIRKCDIVMQQAIDQTTEDIQILLPYTSIGAEMVNTLNSDPVMGQNAAMTYDSICALSENLETLLGHSIEELVLNGTLGEVIRDDIASEYRKRSEDIIFKPSDIDVHVSFNADLNVIDLYVEYTIETLFGDIDRSHYSAIPFYGLYNSLINHFDYDSSEEEDSADPWGMNNFDRGEYFEDKYGSNLPHVFPAINKFEDGNCESIMSIDLTKDTYQSDFRINERISEKLSELDEFNGANVSINGETYVIEENEIVSKTLTIIIPENSPQSRVESLENSINAYSNDNIIINIIKDNTSY